MRVGSGLGLEEVGRERGWMLGGGGFWVESRQGFWGMAVEVGVVFFEAEPVARLRVEM